MADASPCKKKKKLTLVASQQGIEIAERALIRLGFDSKSNFAVVHLSRSTVSNFFNQVPIQPDSFKRICDALKLKWQDIAGIKESIINHEPIEIPVNARPDLEEGVQQEMLSRQVTVIDKDSQKIKAVITLQGDISLISDPQILEAILKKYGGDSIHITNIQEGSIKLIIEGSQEDIERLLILIKSGELTELDGFPVEDAQILSKSSEDDESSEQKWRLVEEIVTNQIIGRDLSGADLSDADLRNAYLIAANLNEADLSDSDLIRANLSGANLIRANLSGADLSGADLSGADLRDANLSSADLRVADLSGANLSSADLSSADLSGAELSGANLSIANLIRADLSGADLSGADLIRADLRVADLIRVNLIRANLSGADLRSANLSSANLSSANLSSANLSGVNLSGVNLIRANLSGADLRSANLRSANLSSANLSSANLSGVNLSGIQVEKTRFLDNLGISEELKKDLIKRGAIFEDSPGDRSRILTRV